MDIIECVRKRGGGKHRNGFVLSSCCSKREEPRALPTDHNKRNDAQLQRRIEYHSQPNTGPFPLLIHYGSRDDWPMV